MHSIIYEYEKFFDNIIHQLMKKSPPLFIFLLMIVMPLMILLAVGVSATAIMLPISLLLGWIQLITFVNSKINNIKAVIRNIDCMSKVIDVIQHNTKYIFIKENIGMNVGMFFLGVVVIVLMGYLFYALIYPEKF